ncbi:MAG: hypothetical protein AAGD08_15955 [Pseudomonadota bacterium]
MPKGNTISGEYTGDGAAQNISIGFVPARVTITNETDLDAAWYWTEQHPDGSATLISDGSTIASNGVTPYAGTSTSPAGFTIGTALSESGKTFNWVAERGDA